MVTWYWSADTFFVQVPIDHNMVVQYYWCMLQTSVILVTLAYMVGWTYGRVYRRTVDNVIAIKPNFLASVGHHNNYLLKYGALSAPKMRRAPLKYYSTLYTLNSPMKHCKASWQFIYVRRIYIQSQNDKAHITNRSQTIKTWHYLLHVLRSICQLTVRQMSTIYRPTVEHLSANCRAIIDQKLFWGAVLHDFWINNLFF